MSSYNFSKRNLPVIVYLAIIFIFIYILFPFTVGFSGGSHKSYEEVRSCSPQTNGEKIFITHRLGCIVGKWLTSPIKKE